MMESFFFLLFAAMAAGGAIMMIASRNPVSSLMYLVLAFFALSGIFVLLDAHFLAAVQVIVYAGAIMVLFLFVLMLLGVGSETRFSDRIRGQRTAAVLLGGALAALLVVAGAGQLLGPDAICPADGSTGQLCAGLAGANAAGNVAGVGRLLFTTYMWPFEVTSALLVIAALGAMVLGKRRADEDVTDRPPADEPVDGDDADEDLEPRGELVATSGEPTEEQA